jgi:hypothetical protein
MIMACHSPLFKASPLITLLTPLNKGSSEAAINDPRPSFIASFAVRCGPTSGLHQRFRSFGKLRIRNRRGRFALDGGTALAFLAQS